MKEIIGKKSSLGILLAIIIVIAILIMPIDDIEMDAKIALALILMTVIFWAFKVTDPGFSSLLFLILVIVTKIAPPEIVLSLWTSQIMYIVIGAYLIAQAVNKSGLGERIAYMYMLRFVNSFKSLIISSFTLQVILSLIIPHPWPRAFLVLSVMMIISENANLSKKDTALVGLSVFTGAIPTAMIFLTGDSTINFLIVSIAGVEVSWINWFIYMGIPAIIASTLVCILIMFLFKSEGDFSINKDLIKEKLKSLGKLTTTEKKTVFWVATAVILWITDSLHGIDLGWVTIIVVVCMSLPKIGELLDGESFKTIPFSTLLFLTAAMSIGKISSYTGLTDYIANTLLPASIPSNIFLLGALVVCVSVLLHMFMGSVMAAMSIAAPVFVGYVAGGDISPLVPALMVYSSVAFHFILPYQHLTILIGMGDSTGKYTESDVIKLGAALTIVVFITVLLVEIPWWSLLNLI